ncbi:hypothetical protein AAD018_006220 [Aestuariibius insulae]|uniref:hypothetical protein n=1 Tax=Aestuariibius insulae TaxID=2058287 RepID=UPI00398EF4D9
MLTDSQIEEVERLAATAPDGAYGDLPLIWRHEGATSYIDLDTSLWQRDLDPDGRLLALACGARIEAAVLVLSQHNVSVRVANMLSLRLLAAEGRAPVAILLLSGGETAKPAQRMIARRQDWTVPFAAGPVDLFGWSPDRARLVTDAPGRDLIADLAREVTKANAEGVAAQIRSAAVVALHTSPVEMKHLDSGRMLYRLWLDATGLRLAGRQIDALAADAATSDLLSKRYAVAPDRRLDAVVCFGPTDPPEDRSGP